MSNELIIAIGIVLILTVLILALIAVRQRRQIQDLQRPKYGFLGKPIYSAIAVLLVFGIVGLTFININNQNQGIEVRETYKVSLQLSYTIISSDVSTVKVKLNVVPTVNGHVWGNQTDKFNATWTVTNLTNKNQITNTENDLSIVNSGGLVVDLPRGSYSAEVKVQYLGKFFSNKIQFQL